MIIYILTICAVVAALTVQSLLLHRLLNTRQPPKQQQETEHEAKSPMDQGFDNIMRYEVGGWTGFEQEEGRY